MILFKPKEIVIVRVDYFVPDYSHILNEFLWETDDYWPEVPRVHQFLKFWHNHIDAVINQVCIAHAAKKTWNKIDFMC